MKYLNIAAVCVALGALTHPAVANPVVQTTACLADNTAVCASGIRGLKVGDKLVDLSFSRNAYRDVYSGSNPFFLGDETAALAAVAAIVDALNSAQAVAGLAETQYLTDSFLFVPYAEGATDSANPEIITYNGISIEVLNDTWSYRMMEVVAHRDSNIQLDAYAIFDQVAVTTPPVVTRGLPTPEPTTDQIPEPSLTVPVPGTLAVLGLGLVTLVLGRRKRA